MSPTNAALTGLALSLTIVCIAVGVMALLDAVEEAQRAVDGEPDGRDQSIDPWVHGDGGRVPNTSTIH